MKQKTYTGEVDVLESQWGRYRVTFKLDHKPTDEEFLELVKNDKFEDIELIDTYDSTLETREIELSIDGAEIEEVEE